VAGSSYRRVVLVQDEAEQLHASPLNLEPRT
jgi:hypothetical protein